jgi:hypothetical protein
LDLPTHDSSAFDVLLSLIPDPQRPPIAVVVLPRLTNPTMHETVLHHRAEACLVKRRTSAIDLREAIEKAIVSVSPTH